MYSLAQSEGQTARQVVSLSLDISDDVDSLYSSKC